MASRAGWGLSRASGGGVEYAAEAGDAFADLAGAEASEAEDDAGLALSRDVVAGDAVDADATLLGAGDDGGFVEAVLWPKDDVCAGALAGDFNAIPEDGVDGVEEGVAARAVAAADAAEEALVEAAGEELGEGLLLEGGGVAVGDPLGGGERGDKGARGDEVADAQGGEDGARERAEVEDAAFTVQSLEGGQGLTAVAEFAVVVVFNDDGAATFGPVEQREAACEREHGAGGELVRRRDEDHARAGGDFFGNDAVVIDADGAEAGAGGAESVARALVAGVFDGDGVVGLDEDANDEVDGLCGAVDDDDLRRVADDATGSLKVGGDGFLKSGKAGGGCVIELVNARTASIAQQQAAPGFKGEDVDVTAAVDEVVA